MRWEWLATAAEAFVEAKRRAMDKGHPATVLALARTSEKEDRAGGQGWGRCLRASRAKGPTHFHLRVPA
eukprot:1857492-Alexandrium_andersonii.AAC.1